MHHRRPFALLVVAAITLGITGCSSSAQPATQCAAKPDGALCLHVIKVGKVVGDVIGYVSYSGTYLTGKTSRIVLSRYACDPGTGSQPACAPSTSYPGRTHRGLVTTTFCRDQSGATITAPPGCHNSEWEELATDGDWSGFSVRPDGLTFPAGTWLCISEQIRIGRTWQPVTTTSPIRACAQAG